MKHTKFVVRWDCTTWYEDGEAEYSSGESNVFISHIVTDALNAAIALRDEMRSNIRAWAEQEIDVYNLRVVRITEDVVC
jgi:hypothetical protein